jgi:hypothetical protein
MTSCPQHGPLTTLSSGLGAGVQLGGKTEPGPGFHPQHHSTTKTPNVWGEPLPCTQENQRKRRWLPW